MEGKGQGEIGGAEIVYPFDFHHSTTQNFPQVTIPPPLPLPPGRADSGLIIDPDH